MSRPRFATLLSIAMMLSWPCGGFCATAVTDGAQDGFVALERPRDVPLALIQTERGDKRPLVDLLRAQKTPSMVFLHIWAPYCPPCAAEMKTLESLRPALERKGVVVLAIAEDPDGAVTVPAFKRRHDLPNLVPLIDVTRALANGLNPQGLPTTYRLSSTGKITAEHAGPVDWRAMLGPD